jgi:hypothetical protein
MSAPRFFISDDMSPVDKGCDWVKTHGIASTDKLSITQPILACVSATAATIHHSQTAAGQGHVDRSMPRPVWEATLAASPGRRIATSV